MRRVFISLFVGYSIAVLLMTAKGFYENYREVWGVVLPNGRVAGADFLCFYVAGKLYRENQNSLYDFGEQIRRQHEMIQNSGTQSDPKSFGVLPFVYPPLVAAVFSIFSRSPYLVAYAGWAVLSIVLFSSAMLAVLTALPLSFREKFWLFVCALAFQPFIMECIGGGQTAALGTAIFSAIFVQLRREREFTAGLILSLGYYKPPLFIGYVICLLLLRRFRFLLGAVVGGMALTGLTICVVGTDGLAHYLSVVSSYSYGSELLEGVSLPPDKGMGLYGAITTLIGNHPETFRLIYITLSILLLAISLYTISRTSISQTRVFALLISLSLFLSPQFVVYDLTILLLPILLFVTELKKQSINELASLVAVGACLGLFFEWLVRADAFRILHVNLASALLFLFIIGQLMSSFGPLRKRAKAIGVVTSSR